MLFAVACFVFALSASVADAATFFVVPEGSSFGVGVEFTADLKLDTGTTSINATKASVHFPPGMLELVAVDKSNSVFAFWLEEPTISNTDGVMSFTGGTSKGISGSALQIVRMRFKTKGVGSAAITISDAIVTASDGKGTNVLEALQGGTILINPQTLAPAPPPPPAPPPVVPAGAAPEQPVRVIREPVAAKVLPKKPEIRVPFYPDQSRWYNSAGEAIVFWDLPPDVVAVSTRLSHNAFSATGVQESELFSGKNLGIIGEGVWYVRVQFKNNVGWGEAAYYKMSIDRTPPVSFEVEADVTTTDNPSPLIRFEASDSLSGILEYLVFLEDPEPVRTTENEMKLPPMAPGMHAVVVRALDLAGNSVEDTLELEILPLPTPSITFITQTVPEGESVFAFGKSIPNGVVELRVVEADGGREVFSGEVSSDNSGKWEAVIDEPLSAGGYSLSVTARDERGALSYPSTPIFFSVSPKPVITIGFLNLGWSEIVLFGLLLAAAAIGNGGWQYARRQNKRGAYQAIAGRDIQKFGVMLENDIKELEERVSAMQFGVPEGKREEAEHLFEKTKNTIERMKKYLGQEVEKLK